MSCVDWPDPRFLDPLPIPAYSATISVELSGVRAIPLGKTMWSATRRADPSEATNATMPVRISRQPPGQTLGH
jgi:hypothetical protein